MPGTTRCRRALAAALAACLLVSSVALGAATQWQTAVPADGTEHSSGSIVAMLPDGGYLTQRLDGKYSMTGLAWMSEFDANGALRRGPRRHPAFSSWAWRVRTDGGLLYRHDPYNSAGWAPKQGCEMLGRLFGRTMTTHDLLDGADTWSRESWLLPTQQLIFSPGAQDREPNSLAALDAFCDTRAVVIAPLELFDTTLASDGRSAIGLDWERKKLLRVGLLGEMWSLDLPGTHASIAAIATDGDVLVRYNHGLSRIGEDGTVRWQLPMSAFQTSITDITTRGNQTYVIDGERAANSIEIERPRINVLDAQGNRIAQHEVTGRIVRFPSIANTATWRVEPATRTSTPYPVKIVTVSPAGALQTLGEFDSSAPPSMQLATGRIVFSDYGSRASYLYDPRNGERLRLGTHAHPRGKQLETIFQLENGALLMTRDGDATLRLIRVDVDGAQRWQRRLPAVELQSFAPLLDANARRICILNQYNGETRLHCVDADTGNDILADLRSPVHFTSGRPMIRLTADDSLQLVGNECVRFPEPDRQGCKYERFVRATLAPDGNLAAHETLSRSAADVWRWTESGRLVSAVYTRSNAPPAIGTDFTVYDEHGNESFAFGVPRIGALLGVDADGTMLTGGGDFNDDEILALHGPNGRRLWEVPTWAKRATHWASPLPGGDWVLLGNVRQQPYDPLLTLVERRDGNSGALRWQQLIYGHYLYGAPRHSAQATLDEAHRRLWVVAPGRNRSRMIAIDVTDGTLSDAHLLEVPAGEDAGYLSSANVIPGDDGVIAGWVREADQSLQVAKLVPTPTLAAATPAAGGIWHAADTEGQGLVLERFDGNTLGGAWFTFSRIGGSAISEKRWYTLQGTLDGDGNYTLTIYTTRGGAFAAAPSVDAEPVGNARLRMTGCNSALLTYHFSEGELRDLSGIVPLQRTAGSAQGCTSSATTTAANDAAGALSGSYFDPEASGQGLLLQAVGDGTMLAGAWFTFDPAGKANDPDAQHWFSASGPLEEGGSGTLTLYRTFGAAFDVGRTINTVAVGTLQVSPEGCGITIAWSFDDSLAAGDFAGGEGSQRLQRLGACPR